MVSVNVVNGVAEYELDTGERCKGDYVVTGSYQRNDCYEGASGSGVLSVLGLDVSMTLSGCSGLVGGSVSVVASVLDEDDGVVTGGSVLWELFEEDVLDVGDISDWDYGVLEGSSVSGVSLVSPSVDSDDCLLGGRGYLVWYDTPLGGVLDEFVVRCSVCGGNRWNRVGISSLTHDNVNGTVVCNEPLVLLSDVVGVVDSSTVYELEFKFFDGIVYLFVDGVFSGWTADYTGVVGDLYFVTYSNYELDGTCYPVVVSRLSSVDCVDLNSIPVGSLSVRTLDTDLSSNWSFVSRGEGSTSQVFNDDGTLQLGIYNYHIWKQAIDTSKKYNIYFYKETIYGDLYIGVGNSNTTTPTRFPAMVINQTNAGITNQSINKATIYYENEAEKWYLMINDNPQYVKEQTDNNNLRYISIRTETNNTASQNRILAITEENKEE